MLVHDNNPPEYIGNWFGHSDAARWAERLISIDSAEAIALGHVVAGSLTAKRRPGLWLIAAIYAAIGAMLWIMLIAANV